MSVERIYGSNGEERALGKFVLFSDFYFDASEGLGYELPDDMDLKNPKIPFIKQLA